MPVRSRAWKVGVLKVKAQHTPKLLVGLKERKEGLVRQLVHLHTLKLQAKERLKQHSKGSGKDLVESGIKKQVSDDLNDVVRKMKDLRTEMRRRGMHMRGFLCPTL